MPALMRSAMCTLLRGGQLGQRRCAVMQAPKCGLYTVNKPRRQFIRPLGNGLGLDADCLGCQRHRAAKELNGVVFLHALMLAHLHSNEKYTNLTFK